MNASDDNKKYFSKSFKTFSPITPLEKNYFTDFTEYFAFRYRVDNNDDDVPYYHWIRKNIEELVVKFNKFNL